MQFAWYLKRFGLESVLHGGLSAAFRVICSILSRVSFWIYFRLVRVYLGDQRMRRVKDQDEEGKGPGDQEDPGTRGPEDQGTQGSGEPDIVFPGTSSQLNLTRKWRKSKGPMAWGDCTTSPFRNVLSQPCSMANGYVNHQWACVAALYPWLLVAMISDIPLNTILIRIPTNLSSALLAREIPWDTHPRHNYSRITDSSIIMIYDS